MRGVLRRSESTQSNISTGDDGVKLLDQSKQRIGSYGAGVPGYGAGFRRVMNTMWCLDKDCLPLAGKALCDWLQALDDETIVYEG